MSRANSSVVARELLAVSWLVDRQAQRCGVIRWNESSVSPPSSRSTTGKGPHEQLSHCQRCLAEVSSCAIRAVLECPSDLDHSAVTLHNQILDPWLAQLEPRWSDEQMLSSPSSSWLVHSYGHSTCEAIYKKAWW